MPLSKGSIVIPAGAVIEASTLPPGATDKLLAIGAIAPVSSPPLAELPGWRVRAKKLSMLGITTIADLAEADTERVADHMRVKPGTVKTWKQVLVDTYLTVKGTNSC